MQIFPLLRTTALGLAISLVFGLRPGDAHQIEVLHSFGGSGDGSDPISGLLRDNNGNLFGTTFSGGRHGKGTVFKITADGTETVLYSFSGGKRDGANPITALVADTIGNLYGTTGNGGKGCHRSGCGVVFKLAPDGIEAVLHFFSGHNDGAGPYGSLTIDSAGGLYGTAVHGGDFTCGSGGCGTVYKIDQAGAFTKLYGFKGWNQADGAFPEGRLLIDSDGDIYGTTVGGGLFESAGTAFKLAPDGVETVLHYFGGGDDGTAPEGLSVSRAGRMFGTTVYGGGSSCRGGEGCGTIYKLATDGTETVLYRFNGNDGSVPVAELTADHRGNLYGAAEEGGSQGVGVVYKLAHDGTFTPLHSFCPRCKSGWTPEMMGGLVLDKGYLFGTAAQGGKMGGGAVYKIKK